MIQPLICSVLPLKHPAVWCSRLYDLDSLSRSTSVFQKALSNTESGGKASQLPPWCYLERDFGDSHTHDLSPCTTQHPPRLMMSSGPAFRRDTKESLCLNAPALTQMFGFDVLVDEQHRPHLLEVNFAPSLNTDSDLDLEVKSKVVADLLTLAGIRGSPGFRRPPSLGADANVATRRPSEAFGEKHGSENDAAGGVDGGDRNEDDCAQTSTESRPKEANGEDLPVAPRACKYPTGGKASGRAPRRGGGQGRGGVGPGGAEGGVCLDFVDQVGRPKTKGERTRPISRPRSRQRNAGDRSGGDGGHVGGDRAAPAWEGSFRRGDGASPSADEVSATKRASL